MNNLPSYCGLVDAKISASEKDLPVSKSSVSIHSSKTINNSAYPIPIHKLLEESRVFVSILSLLSTTVEP